MDDREYFKQYLLAFEMIFNTKADDCVFVKDINFKYKVLSDEMLILLGADSRDHVLGKNITEWLSITNSSGYDSALIKQWEKQDLQIQNTLKRNVYLEVISCSQENKVLLHYKIPIINPNTNNFVGIRGQITKVIWPNIIKILLKMHGTKGLLMARKQISTENLSELYPLSDLQHIVLFLCLHKYSYSEISLLMNEFGYNTNPIRVNDYLEQLKLIFHVRTKNQLIEKSIGIGFDTMLPRGLFNQLGSIDVSNEEAKIIYKNNFH